jgi:hypothetical protein
MDRDKSSITEIRARTTENWHLTFIIGPGSSVEHFHHFLLGLFVPLIYRLSTVWVKAQFNRLIVRSCGPLDHIVHVLGDDRIEIIDKDRHRHMMEATVHSSFTSNDLVAEQAEKLRFVTVRGCDFPVTYDKRQFAKAREVLLSIGTIRSEINALTDQWPRGDARILLINRGPSDPFYDSEQSEIKGSGQGRRSIPNYEALHRLLRQEYVGCLSVMTEQLSFPRQFALFSLADIIIAQHGAALSNMIWARPSATVIEIFPITQRPGGDFFVHLAHCMGLRYRRILQERPRSDVDIGKIREVVVKTIAAPPHRVVPWSRSVAFTIFRPTIPMRRWLCRGWNKATKLGRTASGRGRVLI